MPARALALSVALIAVTGCAVTQRHAVPVLRETGRPPIAALQETAAVSAAITVMTLNAAHGRSNGIHQLFQSGRRHRQNLDDIATVLRRERPQLVALQEADGPSAWSGGFSHVEYLASESGYRHFVRGEHVRGAGLRYGTALLSNLPLDDPLSVTFAPTLAGTPKGFIVSAVRWPGAPSLLVDVVSVHLDPLRAGVRARQIAELAEIVANRDRPIILMGDFNSRWHGRKRLLQRLAGALELATVPGMGAEMITLPKMGRRLDWIFVSPEFEIRSYETLPDVISDHRAVVAQIALRPPLLLAHGARPEAGIPGGTAAGPGQTAFSFSLAE